MKQLWAPWRFTYIEGAKPGECIFCASLQVPPEDPLLLYSGPHSLVVLNKYPYNNGHILIAPKKHVSELSGLSVAEGADNLRLIQHSTTVLKEVFAPDGFNVGMNLGEAAGAGVPGHLHWHVVPRWRGDVNFMPLFAEVRVIPEHIERTLERLRPHFKNI